MSGGSYDYLCYKVQEAAIRLCDSTEPAYRRAFGLHLKKIAEALHDIEWVDSCDMGTGDDEKAIMECILPDNVLFASCEEAQRIKQELEDLINRIEDKK
jgi:hypothetical protein